MRSIIRTKPGRADGVLFQILMVADKLTDIIVISFSLQGQKLFKVRKD